MGYWLSIAVRARREALGELRWTSPLKVAQSVVPTTASGGVTWVATGEPAWGALASIVALAVVGAAWFCQRMLQLPAVIDKEQREALAALKAEQQAQRALKANAESTRRDRVIQQLIGLYIDSHDGISPEMRNGFELPPEDWLNEKLAEIGEPWSVFNIQGRSYQTFEVVGPVP